MARHLLTSDPRGRLERMLETIRADFPNLRLVEKRTVPWMRVAARVLYPLMPGFETHVTTVIGSTVYLPGPPSSMDPNALAAILAHEYVHQLDQRDHGTLFYLSYGLTPLPCWRTHRAWWERRAYAVDMMLAHQEGGDAALAALESRLRALFAGPAYGWMWGGRSAAASFLRSTAQSVREGRLQRHPPYDRILAAWTGR